MSQLPTDAYRLCVVVALLLCYELHDSSSQTKEDLWNWKHLTGREIAAAYEAVIPSLRHEFDISLDSLKMYVVYPEGHDKKGRTRIRLSFYHPTVDTVRDSWRMVRLMVDGFPNYFQVSYFPDTKRIEVEWTATPAQKAMADSVARPYIHKYFKIGPDSLMKYYVKYSSHVRDGQKRVTLDFLYPKVFPHPETISGVSGGYPAYFSVSIDVKRKRVVDWYASEY